MVANCEFAQIEAPVLITIRMPKTVFMIITLAVGCLNPCWYDSTGEEYRGD